MTAYEMRISDWSSDVFSSDLYDKSPSLRPLRTCALRVAVPLPREACAPLPPRSRQCLSDAPERPARFQKRRDNPHQRLHRQDSRAPISAAPQAKDNEGDRKSVVQGKGV